MEEREDMSKELWEYIERDVKAGFSDFDDIVETAVNVL